MSYRELYDHVFGPDAPPASPLNKIKTLAQLLYNDGKNDSSYTKGDAVWEALERYEDMTGAYYDPTHEEYEDIRNSIH